MVFRKILIFPFSSCDFNFSPFSRLHIFPAMAKLFIVNWKTFSTFFSNFPFNQSKKRTFHFVLLAQPRWLAGIAIPEQSSIISDFSCFLLLALRCLVLIKKFTIENFGKMNVIYLFSGENSWGLESVWRCSKIWKIELEKFLNKNSIASNTK